MGREHKVKVEKFKRPTTLGFLARVDRMFNLSAIAREVKSYEHKNTFISQINRHTDMTETVERKAQAEEVGEIMNELWYVIGVGIGKIPPDPHKKFKYFYLDDTERLKDSLTEIEEFDEKGKI